MKMKLHLRASLVCLLTDLGKLYVKDLHVAAFRNLKFRTDGLSRRHNWVRAARKLSLGSVRWNSNFDKTSAQGVSKKLHSRVALWHTKPVAMDIYRNSCRAQGQVKETPCILSTQKYCCTEINQGKNTYVFVFMYWFIYFWFTQWFVN
jgi:hypothetical protein